MAADPDGQMAFLGDTGAMVPALKSIAKQGREVFEGKRVSEVSGKRKTAGLA